MEHRLAGRRVVVTGGSAGIGRATAELAVAAGAQVACMARDPARLEEVAGEIGALAVPADVLDQAGVARALEQVADAFGGIDGLVNSAGDYRPGPVGESTLDDWRHMFEVNVLGLLNVTKEAMPHLKAQERSDIVNVSSMGGRRVGRIEATIYSGTKFAVHALSEGLRRELFDEGVRVSVIAPGAVATQFGLAEAPPEEVERILDRRARIGLGAEHVADQVIHVLSQPAEVTIQEIALTSTSQPPG